MKAKNLFAIILVVGIAISSLGILATLRDLRNLPITGLATTPIGTTNATVGAVVDIELIVSEVNFGQINVGDSNDTIDDVPLPFTIRNNGNSLVNITVNATDLWEQEPNPSMYYQFNSTENETGSVVDSSLDLVDWTNMTNTTTFTKLVDRMNYTDVNDEVNSEINITVPTDESAGSKSSLITFTAAQS